MQNKLQELTDKLYNEGLSKGKQEGEEMVKNAKLESEKIISQAKIEADRIIAEAQKSADELTAKVTADVKMAAIQSIAATKQDIETMVVTKAVDGDTAKALTSEAFVKEMIKSVVAAFNPNNAVPVDLDIIFPETLKKQLDPFITSEIQKQFKSEISVSYSKKIAGGFKVAPKGSGYVLCFTDDEFKDLISTYLRPATKKILFG
jgi:hypothetical protein